MKILKKEEGKINKENEMIGEGLSSKRKDVIDECKKRYEDKVNEVNSKLYLINGGKDTADKILDFLKNDVKWKNHECLGVIKCYEDVLDASKKDELMVSQLCVKALWYFISNSKSGVGLESAIQFKKDLFEPISNAMERVLLDEKEIEKLKEDWNAAFHGIVSENETEETVNETQK